MLAQRVERPTLERRFVELDFAAKPRPDPNKGPRQCRFARSTRTAPDVTFESEAVSKFDRHPRPPRRPPKTRLRIYRDRTVTLEPYHLHRE